jgi:hypothetical protein
MADEQQPQAGQPLTPPTGIDPASLPAASKPTPQPEDVSDLPAWAQSLVSDLRKENASHRTAKTAAERQAQQAQEQAAKDQGKWKELAEQYEPKAKQADDLLQFATELLEDELKDIPAKFKTLIPKYDNPRQTIMWIRDARRSGLFAPPAAPLTDAGAGGTAESQAAGNAAQEQAVWQRLGLNNALRAQQLRTR